MLMSRLSLAHGVAAVALASLLLGGNSARASACALDQTPSVFADGQRAQVNPVVAKTQAQLARWTYFIFARPYAADRPVTLTEDRREVARTLMPSALRQPWGWQFGDGRIAVGWTVRHTYTHAGSYRIRVYCWNPEARQWDAFDLVTIRIR